MRIVALLLVAASLAVSGCFSTQAPTADADPAGPMQGPAAPEDLSKAGGPGGAPKSPSSAEGGAHDHSTHEHASAFEWAPVDSAVVRPGVQVVSETGQCTANFLFVGADGVSVYLGLAAHCFEGLDLGAPVDIADGAARGALAYSSWLTMDEVEEEDATVREYNDFALVLLDEADRSKANPSMLHFGGPVGLADSSAVATGDKVLTYGNSGMRPTEEPLSWHEGYVVETSTWSTTVYTLTPGIPGDSGSGVLDAQGRALGVVVTLTLLPLAGSNGVTHLDKALAYAKENAALDVTLATAELADPGMLPT